MEADFNRPVCKKRKLWERVSREMKSVGNYDVSESFCDSKYRNLLCTYRINKRKQKDTGEDNTPIKWEFFDMMDRVLGTKASSNPPEGTLGDTCMDDNTKGESERETATGSLESDSEEATKKPKQKKNQRELSIKEYLFLKLEKDQKKDTEKAQKEEERWKDKKELKLKEIDAINNLAAAIGSTINKNKKPDEEN